MLCGGFHVIAFAQHALSWFFDDCFFLARDIPVGGSVLPEDLQQCKDIEIEHGSGNSHQCTVEAVEHASVSRQDVAGIFDT